jgi:hypothetical protein
MAQRRKASGSADRGQPAERSGNVQNKIMKALAPGAMGRAPQPATDAVRPAADERVAARAAIAFRPMARPPIAVLTMCDDGKPEGAAFRIVRRRFVIGRTEGHLRIEIDGRISARHVEISLLTIAGRNHRWVLTDLHSTHGLFVRVRRARLADQAEFLVGNGRYRFDAPRFHEGVSTDTFIDEGSLGTTDPWCDDTTPIQAPTLTELINHEIGNRVILAKPEYWIGSDAACAICRENDPFCEPRHARVYRGPRGSWQVEHSKTHNGLWMRISQVAVESTVHFQIGEQRFRLRVR